MGTFSVEVQVGDTQGARYERVEALVDTGTAFTVVSALLLRRLGVSPRRRGTFKLADGSLIEMDMGQTWVRVDGQDVVTIVVFGKEDVTPLLGAYTLEGLQLAPDPVNRRLVSASEFPLMEMSRS